MPQLRSLTSLRFIAATSILFHHLQNVMWIPKGALYPFGLGAGVAFFFVLSGFVLHFSYHARMQQVGYRNFAIQRFLRIWPAHVVVLILCAVWLVPDSLSWQAKALSESQLVRIFFLLQAWSLNSATYWGLNSPAWSLSVELFFYFSFPLMLLVLKRTAVGLFAGLLVLTFAWLWYANAFLQVPDTPYRMLGVGYIFPLVRVAEFGLGMVTSHILMAHADRRVHLPDAVWSVLEVGVLLAVVCQNYFAADWYQWAKPIFGSEIAQWIRSSGGAPLYALVIAVFAQERGAVSGLLARPLFVWLGTISFAEYLLHQPLIRYWKAVVVPVVDNTLVQVTTFVVVLIVSSALLHRFVELPGVQFAKWLTRRKRVAVMPDRGVGA
jgi:peptidoglycan/LPS O-acetylase OafA/YrhL